MCAISILPPRTTGRSSLVPTARIVACGGLITAVINPPQSTILAVGASEERAVVRNGKIEAAHIMSVTMSCDHRSIDGALGAELIGAFKQLIENPVMMMV